MFKIFNSKKLEIFSDKKISEEFRIAFALSPTNRVVKCQFCGRVHFVNDISTNIDSSAYETYLIKLIKKRKSNPERYIQHTQSINCGYIEGKYFVADCACNVGSKYEEFIKSCGYNIKTYFELIARNK